MKIAFIVNGFPSLSESFIVTQITGLLDAGHDVRIFANFNPNQPQLHDDILKYNLPQRTRYIPHIPRNKMLRRLKTICLIARHLLKDPLPLIKALTINLRRQTGFHYKPLYYAFALLGGRFDIIHAHFGPAGNAGLLLKQAGFAPKLVTTFHGYDVTSYIQKRGKNIYSQLFSDGDIFTYNSNATKKKLLDLGCPSDKMIKIPMGIHLDRMTFNPRQIQPGQPTNILSVGRLVQMKGREYAIKAVAKIIPQNPGITYNIVGDGPLRQSLQKLIDDLALTDKIHLLGWVSEQKLDSLYQASQIFLHPSVTADDGNMEGQGVVLLEAQACGMVVVATNHSAFPETVLDEKSGFLVPEKDIDALAEKLQYLIKNPQVWPQMGKAGRRHAEENYDIKKLNKKLADVYENLVK
jgi:colanic acid/amylovoran biosynthesis glycosyltransferase